MWLWCAFTDAHKQTSAAADVWAEFAQHGRCRGSSQQRHPIIAGDLTVWMPCSSRSLQTDTSHPLGCSACRNHSSKTQPVLLTRLCGGETSCQPVITQWSPTPGSWSGTGPSVNWYRVHQKNKEFAFVLIKKLPDSLCYICLWLTSNARLLLYLVISAVFMTVFCCISGLLEPVDGTKKVGDCC